MPSASGPVDLLRALSAALRVHGCRWYLFGAQAVTIWGRPRLTTDVDVTIQLGSGRTEALLATLATAGFRLGFAATDAFVRVTRVLPLVHESSGMPLDIVLGGPGLEDQFLDRAITVRIGELSVPVISPEDLIVTKVLAGRAKDIEDIRGLLAARAASMDIAYVRGTLAAIEEALGQSDLRPLFEAELSRVTPPG